MLLSSPAVKADYSNQRDSASSVPALPPPQHTQMRDIFAYILLLLINWFNITHLMVNTTKFI